MVEGIMADHAMQRAVHGLQGQVTPPPLSGEVEFPTLKPLSGEASFPGLEQIGQRGVAEAFPVPDTAFGTGFNPNVTKPVANLGTPAVTPMVGGDGQITSANELSSFMAGLNQQAGLPRTQMPATEMASPESVAGLSITGTPLTQGAITSPQLPQAPQPQVPNITTPAPAAGQLSGMITRDSTGQQFGLNEGGNLRELNQTEGAALQGDLDRRRAAREAQVMQTFGQMTPEQLAEQRQIGAQAQFARLSPAEQANVQAGRPPNVSEAQVGQAQAEAVARQADYEQRQVNNRIDSQMRQWERDNPRATEEATAMQRQQLIEQEKLVQKPDAPEGGLTEFQKETLARKDRDFAAKQGAAPAQTQFQKKVAEQMIPAMNEWNQGGNSRAKANIDKLSSVAQDLRDKNLDTRTLVDLLPAASDWARKLVNPSGSDAVDRIRGVAYQSLREILGAQFTEKEGKNLVDTYFNPAMDEDTNAERLEDFVSTLSESYNAKNSMFDYLSKNESMVGYDAQNAEEIVRQALGGGGGASGSPIKGDVNISSEVDSRLSNY
jgi:hypothetical protein